MNGPKSTKSFSKDAARCFRGEEDRIFPFLRNLYAVGPLRGQVDQGGKKLK